MNEMNWAVDYNQLPLSCHEVNIGGREEESHSANRLWWDRQEGCVIHRRDLWPIWPLTNNMPGCQEVLCFLIRGAEVGRSHVLFLIPEKREPDKTTENWANVGSRGPAAFTGRELEGFMFFFVFWKDVKMLRDSALQVFLGKMQVNLPFTVCEGRSHPDAEQHWSAGQKTSPFNPG